MYDFIVGLVASVLDLNAPDTSLTLNATPYYDDFYTACETNPSIPLPPARKRPTVRISAIGYDASEQAAIDFVLPHFMALSGYPYKYKKDPKSADFVIVFSNTPVQTLKDDADGLFMPAYGSKAIMEQSPVIVAGAEQMLIYKVSDDTNGQNVEGFAILKKNVSNQETYRMLYSIFMHNAGFQYNPASEIPSIVSDRSHFGPTLADVFALTFFRQGGVVCSADNS